MPSTRVPLILGAGLIGLPGSGARFTDAVEIQKWVDALVARGHDSIDTAQNYGYGTSEKLLSQLDLHGARVDTKIHPYQPGMHSRDKLKASFKVCREALGAIKVRVLFLHAPDHSVPFEETIEAVDDLYKEGQIEEFGLSNFAAWEVAEIVGICKRRGFITPSVYEGPYNLAFRGPEEELFPCLRKHGIRFAAYSVLGGGILTGKLIAPGAVPEPGSHFDLNWRHHPFYVQRFGPANEALGNLKAVAERHDLQLVEVAYRWLQHHSALVPSDRGVIIGTSNLAQLEKALVESEKGPLPQEVVVACDATWKQVRAVTEAKYFM